VRNDAEGKLNSARRAGAAIGLFILVAIGAGCATTGTPAGLTVGPQSSWDEIRGTPGLVVNAPMIPFGARGVAVTEVCRSGDRLRATAADGTRLETAGTAHRSSYTIEVGRIVGDGETSKFRALFVKPFEVPPCA
jgi:hypothetical protein